MVRTHLDEHAVAQAVVCPHRRLEALDRRLEIGLAPRGQVRAGGNRASRMRRQEWERGHRRQGGLGEGRRRHLLTQLPEWASDGARGAAEAVEKSRGWLGVLWWSCWPCLSVCSCRRREG